MSKIDDLINKKRHYLSHPNIPDYLKNVITIKDFREILIDYTKQIKKWKEKYERVAKQKIVLQNELAKYREKDALRTNLDHNS